MTTKHDNPPAFARPASFYKGPDELEALMYPQSGMTLRDYFAARALSSLIRNWRGLSGDAKEGPLTSMTAASYRFADAMLAERAK